MGRKNNKCKKKLNEYPSQNRNSFRLSAGIDTEYESYRYGNCSTQSDASFRPVYTHRNYRASRIRHYHKDRYKKEKGERNSKHRKCTKNLSRSPSPIFGSQEYMKKKIEQTSAIIMKQLLNPDYVPPSASINVRKDALISYDHPIETHADLELKEKDPEVVIDLLSENATSSKNKRKMTSQEVQEIHSKIMHHLNNLNDGRKKNLINSTNSGYDATIQHFVKQQRLHISRALRNMCSSNQIPGTSDIINSIIPDIGIKLEDLPIDVIEQLSHTFGCDLNVDSGLSANGNNQMQELCPSFEFNQAQFNIMFEDLPKHHSEEISNSIESACETECLNSEIMPANEAIEICGNAKAEDSHKNENDVKDEIDISEVKIEQQQLPEFQFVDLCMVKKEPEDEKKDIIIENDEDNDINNLVKENVEIKKEETLEVVFNSIPKGFQTSSIVDHIIEKELKYNSVEQNSSSTQTDFENMPFTIDTLLKNSFKEEPSSLSKAVSVMTQIDSWICKLTKFRQKIFIDLNRAKNYVSSDNIYSEDEQTRPVDDHKTVEITDKEGRGIKRKKVLTELIASVAQERNTEASADNYIEEITYKDIDESSMGDVLMNFEEIEDIVVLIKVVEDKLVAASETGKIYIYSLRDGRCLQIFSLQSQAAVTSLLIVRQGLCTTNMYIGTFRDYLQVYSFHSYHWVKSIPVCDTIECMDTKWDCIFIGCVGGWLHRYSIEKEEMEYEEKFGNGAILSLKATVEGPRRILITAIEESPLCIRDAMNGLHLRVIAKLETFNVFSMIFNRNLIYCGTNSGDVLVLSFHNGSLLQTITIKDVKGRMCMKLYRNVLFITYREKNVHLYDLELNKFIGNIEGPGGSIVSMEIIRNQLVVGTKSGKFKAIPIAWNSFKND